MLENILNGELPSAVFKKLIEADLSIGNIRLAEILYEEFSKLDSMAGQLVWRWKGPGKNQGLSDENLDALLLRFFKDAGYL